MNDTDVVVRADIDVGKVVGLEAVRREIAAAAAAGVGDAFGAVANSAAVKRKAALDSLLELMPQAKEGTTKERLATQRAIRRYLNIVSRHDFSTEAHKEIAVLEEQVNATMQVLRGRARRQGVLESTRIFSDEDKEARRQAAAKSAASLKGKVTRSLNQMAAGEGVWAQDDKEAQLDELNFASYNLSEWAKAAEKASTTGLLTREQVTYHNQQKEAIAAQIKELKGINRNTGKTTDILKTVGGFIAAGATGIAFGNKVSNAVAGIYGAEAPFTQMRKTLAGAAQSAGGVIGAVVGGAIGAALAPITGGLSMWVGAALGGGAGSIIGGERNRSQEAARRAQSDATQQMRYRAMYRGTAGAGGWQTGKMVEAATGGMVSANTIESMASGAQEFQANVAFGEVSDSQWLGLAMLPNYYAAMMSGATPEEQMAALQKDTNGMSPGLQQFAMRHAGVPDEMRALINSPIYDQVMRGAIPEAATISGAMEPYQAGLISAQYQLGVNDRRATVAQTRKASRSGSRFDYDPTKGARAGGNEITDALEMLGYGDMGYESPNRLVNMTLSGRKPGTYQFAETGTTIDGQQLTKRELNIYVDNQHMATVGDVYTTEQVGDNVTYTAGGY